MPRRQTREGITFEQFTRYASTLGAILLGLWAAFTYYDTANRELRKPFNDAQLTLCKEASDAAATLASVEPITDTDRIGPTDKVEDAWRVARIRFEQLYWGSLAIVEDENVEDRMVKFRTLLSHHEDEMRTNKFNVGIRWVIQNAALDIAHACRGLVSKTWQISLPALAGKGS